MKKKTAPAIKDNSVGNLKAKLHLQEAKIADLERQLAEAKLPHVCLVNEELPCDELIIGYVCQVHFNQWAENWKRLGMKEAAEKQPHLADYRHDGCDGCVDKMVISVGEYETLKEKQPEITEEQVEKLANWIEQEIYGGDGKSNTLISREKARAAIKAMGKEVKE